MEIAISPRVTMAVRIFWLAVVMPILVVGATVIAIQTFALPVFPTVLTTTILLVLYVLWRLPQAGGANAALRLPSEDLVRAKTQLQHLFEHSPVPYLRLSPDGVIRVGNLAAVRLLQTTIKEITGLSLFSRLASPDDVDVSMFLSKAASGVSVSDTELVLTTTRDEERWVRLSLYVPELGAEEYLVTLVDITQQKKVDLAKSEFVALAAHQLRTPLAAIRWNLELFAQGGVSALPEKTQTYFSKVEKNASRMVMLINDFLSVSKLETGTFEARPETINLTDYLQDIIDEFAPLVQQKQLTIDLETPPTPSVVTVDVRLLHIVTSNLLSNATKYTPQNGTITVSYQHTGSEVTYAVVDTGIGIPREEQTRLFSKFFRASNARKERAQGTGLGLYIVKQSTEMLGGTITCTSEEGAGSTFTATFQVQGAEAA